MLYIIYFSTSINLLFPKMDNVFFSHGYGVVRSNIWSHINFNSNYTLILILLCIPASIVLKFLCCYACIRPAVAIMKCCLFVFSFILISVTIIYFALMVYYDLADDKLEAIHLASSPEMY